MGLFCSWELEADSWKWALDMRLGSGLIVKATLERWPL